MDTVAQNSRVAFMSTLQRELFPFKVPPNRFGNEITPLRGAPHRGPGCYNNEEYTNFWYNIEHKLTSDKGYTLGARTSLRIPKLKAVLGPCPTQYQQHWSDPKEIPPAKKPFEQSSERFPLTRKEVHDVVPGPGTYESEIAASRKVQWHQSFGGPPILLPPVSVTSTIEKNTDKLFSTKEEKKYHRKLAYLKLYYE
ncbi:protein pitchfork-like [Gigantopelta aegis]|uniref:protein pitchfork-like n=1 Tax=Gigantopelta aegis TaxID=1735272 RepID=UPI001B887F91|nr:protein pitchfork-like [Gigantopelta aegis]